MPSPARSTPPDDADVVILCALELERRAVLAALGETRGHGRPAGLGETPRHGRLSGLGEAHSAWVGAQHVVVPAATGMGNTASAAAAQQAIDVWNPRHLLLIGIAAGLPGEVRLGDLLVPDKIIGYEGGRLTPSGLDPDPEPYRPDHGLLTTARAVEPDEWAPAVTVARPDRSAETPAVRFGTVHTGEKVVADEHTAAGLRAGWRKTVGIEMEALGVALAAYRNGPGFLLVKGVCDHANPAKADQWQPYAADCAARFGAAVLHRLPPAGERRGQAVRTVSAVFSGRTKIAVTDRLGPDWHRLADYFEIAPQARAAFPAGREPHGVWEWLERREKLYALPGALTDIGRPDLAALLDVSHHGRAAHG